ETGLWRYKTEQWSLVQAADGIANGPVGALFADRDGAVWAGTPSGVYVKRATSDRFDHYSNQPSIRAFAQSADGTMWIVDAASTVKRISDLNAGGSALAGISGSGPLLRDRRNNLWAATLGNGLLRIDLSDPGHPRTAQLKGDGELSSDVVRAFLED